jgi:methionyl-tRNA formyltransferase
MSASVILFGSVPLATWAASRLMDHDGITLEGVVCETTSRRFEHHGLDEECVFDFARRYDIPVLDLVTLGEHVDPAMGCLGVSVRFSKIIRGDVIRLFRRGIVNFHCGELPRYRGVNIANHCILEGATRGGATMHFIDEGVDTGDIIDRELFPLAENDTAYDVFVRTQQAAMTLIERNLGHIASGRLVGVSQQTYLDSGEVARTYRKTDLDSFRNLRFGMSPERIDRRARAFAFPGHEPAYFVFNGGRIHVLPNGSKEINDVRAI